MLAVEEFGKVLLESEDLDPIYVMLNSSGMDQEQLKRWCLAYWMFYHAGVSSHLSEYRGHDFWYHVAVAATNTGKSYPRGTERRHFRGSKCSAAVAHLSAKFPRPEDAVDYLTGSKLGMDLSYSDIVTRAKTWPQFGPWIAFKIADMVERVLKYPVDFSNCHLDIFTDPVKGGVLVHGLHHGIPLDIAQETYYAISQNMRQSMLSWSIQYLQEELGDYKAPPLYDRLINVQEIETVLCKYKAHVKGHYPLGKDTREVRHGLKGWGPLADRLASCLPRLT